MKSNVELQEMAFDHLTEKQKLVWVKHMREGQSEYATARDLGLTRNAVHDRLNKARRSYRKFIREHKRDNN